MKYQLVSEDTRQVLGSDSLHTLANVMERLELLGADDERWAMHKVKGVRCKLIFAPPGEMGMGLRGMTNWLESTTPWWAN